MTAKIDISPEELAIVQGILKEHVPKGTLAWAFGSRVTWTAKPFSDLDIALEGTAPLAHDVLIDLQEAFEASDLPWKVDVIDLNAVSPEFRAIVERQRADVMNTSIGEVCRFLSGGTPKKSQSDYWGAGYPWFSATNMKGKYLSESEINITEKGLKNGSRLAPKHSTLILVRGSGLFNYIPICYADREVAFNQDVKALVPNEGIDPVYFHYSIEAQRSYLNQKIGVTGIGAGKFDTSLLHELPFRYLDEDSQREIGEAAESFDRKIELNRRMNETLEAMARAVFRDWFVDFGPTRRKAAGITDPVAILGHLLPDPTQAKPLAALFPDSFGDNGLPEGWAEKPLDEIAEFLNGLALQKFPAKAGEDSLPVIKIAELRGGVTAKSNRASRDLSQKYVINDGDFIFSWSGSLMAKFWTEGEGALNQHLFKVSSEAYPAWFYSQWVYHHLDEFQRIAASKATTMGHIQRGHLKAAMTVDPGEAALNAMGGIMGPLLDLAIHNDLENQTLAATRDLLLPKLMSGDLRLTGAEGDA